MPSKLSRSRARAAVVLAIPALWFTGEDHPLNSMVEASIEDLYVRIAWGGELIVNVIVGTKDNA